MLASDGATAVLEQLWRMSCEGLVGAKRWDISGAQMQQDAKERVAVSISTYETSS